MSTQRNNSKQSLQVKVTKSTSGVDNRPNIAARYRLQKLNNTNVGQECRHQGDELAAHRTVRDAIVKDSPLKKLLGQKWRCIPISRDQMRSDVRTKMVYTHAFNRKGKGEKSRIIFMNQMRVIRKPHSTYRCEIIYFNSL